MAKVFKVNASYDMNDLDAGNGLCVAFLIIIIPTVYSVCTLRAAIEEANKLPGNDTILLPSGTYSLSLEGEGEDESGMGDLDITDSLTIIGGGADTTIIDAGELDRGLDVPVSGIEVSLSGITVRNGKVASSPKVEEGGGGGIRNYSWLELDGVAVTDNQVEGGNDGDTGGGLKNLGTCYLENSTIENNYAYEGGGFANISGGIFSLTASSVSDNRADSGGGGVNHLNSYVSLKNSTISSNVVEGRDAIGGGVLNFGILEVVHGTITKNEGIAGGGIHNSGLTYLKNSIVAHNTGGDCRLSDRFVSQGHNLDSDGSCGLSTIFLDLRGVDPLLGPLQINSLGTKYHMPDPWSPVIDRGVALADVTDDQRGRVRPLGKNYDIGAIEREEFSLSPLLYPLLKQ